MDLHAYSDAALLEELGRSLRRRRLAHNWTQATLGERTGLDRMTVGALERGRSGGPLPLLQVLRALGALDLIAPLLEEPGPSPLEIARHQGRERKRASRRRPGGSAAG